MFSVRCVDVCKIRQPFSSELWEEASVLSLRAVGSGQEGPGPASVGFAVAVHVAVV